jgi:hypothetical protein
VGSTLPWLWPFRGSNTIRKNAIDCSLRGAECEQKSLDLRIEID